jgi:hypothetical protein
VLVDGLGRDALPKTRLTIPLGYNSRILELPGICGSGNLHPSEALL